jgi:hypothetical protein
MSHHVRAVLANVQLLAGREVMVYLGTQAVARGPVLMLERGSGQACRPDRRVDQDVGSKGGRMRRLVFSEGYPFRALAAWLYPMLTGPNRFGPGLR